MDINKIKHHVEVLKEKHHLLDQEIQKDYKNFVNDLIIEKKKKEKLAIKDEIEKFIRSME